MPDDKHIYLVGFMGSGKSTVGPLLAESLHRPFFDLDQLIEEESGATIPEIFEARGEKYFRRIERKALQEVTQERPAVIALGGGAFVSESNRRIIRKKGVSVWLQVSLETARRRTMGCPDRPLARNPEVFESRFLQRQDAYRSTDLRVITDRHSPEEVCQKILGLLQSLQRQANRLSR